MNNKKLEQQSEKIIEIINEIIDDFDIQERGREDASKPPSTQEQYEKAFEKINCKIKELKEKIEENKNGPSHFSFQSI